MCEFDKLEAGDEVVLAHRFGRNNPFMRYNVAIFTHTTGNKQKRYHFSLELDTNASPVVLTGNNKQVQSQFQDYTLSHLTPDEVYAMRRAYVEETERIQRMNHILKRFELAVARKDSRLTNQVLDVLASSLQNALNEDFFNYRT